MLAATCPGGPVTDTRYNPDTESNTVRYPSDGVATFYRITRVVGPGGKNEFTNGAPDTRFNGFIEPYSWNLYKSNGVVGANATVSLTATIMVPSSYYQLLLANSLFSSVLGGFFGVSGPLTFPADGYVYAGSTRIMLPVTLEFRLNGHGLHRQRFLLPVKSSGSREDRAICKTFDASWIKFGALKPEVANLGGVGVEGGPACTADLRGGETTCPGINELDAKYTFDPGLERIAYGVGFNPFNIVPRGGQLSFSALSPVLMVQGINTTDSWFRNSRFSPDFSNPFITAKIPFVALYDKRINLGINPGLIWETGTHLFDIIRRFAGYYGANKVHLVAHSKGGLYSRYFLSLLRSNSNFGVLSLTTIDTPHHGSVGADLKQAYGNASDADRRREPFLYLGAAGPDGDQVKDLTVAGVEEFNSNYPCPPPLFRVDGATVAPQYMSISADADIGNKVNGQGRRYVDANDAEAMDLPPPTPILDAPNAMYHLMGDYARVTFQRGGPLTRQTTSIFQLNDLIVTLDSARYPGFQEIQQLQANHLTVGKGAVGTIVLQKIRDVQPIH